MHAVAALLCLGLTGCAATQPSCSGTNNLTQVEGENACLVIRTFGPTAPSTPVLYVVLHGDVSAGGPATYHYDMAKRLAEAGPPGAAAVAMIRPGYYDAEGHTSDGSNNGRRDSYTPQNVAIVADAIRRLKTSHGAVRVVGVGHSGGAAILGVILGHYPHLLDAVVLVSCPCNVTTWRGAGAGRTPWPFSQSPSSFVGQVPADARVVLVSGAADTNTAPSLARDYAASLASRGVDATVVPVARASHDQAFRSPLVVEAAVRLATE